jgi:NADH-quinone oxidoreductase subunit L
MNGVLIALVICAMPLLSAGVIAVFKRQLGTKADLVGIGAMGVALALAIWLAIDHKNVIEHCAHATPWTWFTVAGTVWKVGVSLNGLTLALLIVVTLVSFLVHLFSKGYMHGDSRYEDFYRWLGFFTFSMLGLVISDNLITLFVCWELMGLSSYKLIGHYFQKESAYLACKKAFMTTRVGDVGMFLAMLAIYAYTRSLRFDEIDAALAAGAIPGTAITWIALGLFMGAAGKSAQFPLHVWLPDAMEGPTPVSALIHAATMVAAGVYLVGRMYTLIAMSPAALLVISIVGCFTAIFAASIAFTATDIKKVLAYSTISQLGFMFTALGVGSNMAWQAGLFHLVTHAFFKACLFLGSGSVIHACHHEQDMTRMGGLWKKLPVTGATYLIACLSIAGVPFFTAGFYSKDQILASLWAGGSTNPAYFAIFWVLALTAAMTAFYMFRSFWLTFFTKPRDHHIHEHAHESPATITIPLVVLAALAVCAGGFFGAMTWHDAFLPNEGREAIVRYSTTFAESDKEGWEIWEHAHHFALMVSLCVCTLGIGLSYVCYMMPVGDSLRRAARAAISPLYDAAKAKYWMDEFIEAVIIRTTGLVAALSAGFDRDALDGFVDATGTVTGRASDMSGVADVKVVDGAVPDAPGGAGAHPGTGAVAWGGGGLFTRWQSGKIRNYLFGAVAVTALFAVVVLYMSRS